MDARSIAILRQLLREVWWPADRMGGVGMDYNRNSDHPARNDNRWKRLLGELGVLNFPNPDVRKLEGIYDRPSHWHNRKNRAMWIEAMLR